MQELTSVAGKRFAAKQKKAPPVAIETGATVGGPDSPARIAAFMLEESGLKRGVSTTSLMAQAALTLRPDSDPNPNPTP